MRRSLQLSSLIFLAMIALSCGS